MYPYKREGEGDLTDRRKDWSDVDTSHQKLEKAMNRFYPGVFRWRRALPAFLFQPSVLFRPPTSRIM